MPIKADLQKYGPIFTAIGRKADLYIGCVLCCFALSQLWSIARLGPPVVIDDGFYYLQVARNLARGLGSTFDGINPTNGYHPLWALVLVPVFWLFADNPERALQVSLGLQVVLSSATVGLLFLVSRFALGRLGATTAALLWLSVSHRLSLGGVDLSLSAFFIVATSYAYVSWFGLGAPPLNRHYFWMGLLLAMAFLARLDNCFLIVVIGFSLFVNEIRRGPIKTGLVHLLIFALPLLPLCLGYLAVNVSTFGSIMPVSGAVKAAWSQQLLHTDPIYNSYGDWGFFVAKAWNCLWPLRRLHYPVGLFVFIGAFGGLVFWLLTLLRKKHASPVSRFWMSNLRFLHVWRFLFAAGMLQYCYYALFFHGGVTYDYEWYYVTQPIAGALLAGLCVEQIFQWTAGMGEPRSNQRFARRLMLLTSMILLAALATHIVRLVSTEIRTFRKDGLAQEDGIRWIKNHVGSEAIIGAWNAGALGYLSGRRVINLDGLVNSRDFFVNRREHLCIYWEEMRLEYIADVMDLENGPAAPLPLGYTYANCVDRLVPLASLQPPEKAWRFQIFRFLGGRGRNKARIKHGSTVAGNP